MNNLTKILPKDIELLLRLLYEKIEFLEDSVRDTNIPSDDWIEEYERLHIREKSINKRLEEQGYIK